MMGKESALETQISFYAYKQSFPRCKCKQNILKTWSGSVLSSRRLCPLTLVISSYSLHLLHYFPKLAAGHVRWFQLLMRPLKVFNNWGYNFSIHIFIWRKLTLFFNQPTLIQIPDACFEWQVQTGPVTLLKLSLTRVSTVLKGNRLNCLKGAGLRRVTDLCCSLQMNMYVRLYIFFTE